MSRHIFVDTNVFVYSRDKSEPKKQGLAHQWISQLWDTHLGRLSVQVLNEYYLTVTQKLKPGLSLKEARSDVKNLATWGAKEIDYPSIENAWQIQDSAKLSWWDSLMLASAKSLNCRYFLSEDLQDEREIAGLRIINPFKHRPEEILSLKGSIVGDIIKPVLDE